MQKTRTKTNKSPWKQKPLARELSGTKANGNERKGKKSRLPKAEKT